MTTERRVLVAGFPRAGKSSFADAVERSGLEMVHIPMDRYILPIPTGCDFLEWVQAPSCVDWDLLLEHLSILDSGRICFTPKPDWSNGGRRICLGGPMDYGLGRRMIPKDNGCLIVGTHVFSLAPGIGTHTKVFIDASDNVLASRLEGRLVAENETDQIIQKHLEDNLSPLRMQREEAEMIIDGTLPHAAQISVFQKFLSEEGRNKDLQDNLHRSRSGGA